MKRLVAAAVAVTAVGVLSWLATNGRYPAGIMHVSSIGMAVTLAELRSTSELVMLVRPTGTSNVHWNSADNQQWQDREGASAMIVRDDVFEVSMIVKGSYKDPYITIRGVGGVVGDVTYVHDQQEPWVSGGLYLVFLNYQPTPTREGTEMAWAESYFGQSAFRLREGDLWKNSAQLAVRLQDISE